MTSPTVDVYCPAGFSYVRPNRLRVYLNGCDVTRTVADLINAAYPDGREDTPPYATLVVDDRNPLDREILATHGESFTLDDWANALDDLLALEVVCHDGEEYPG